MEDDFDHGFYADMSFSEIVGLPPALNQLISVAMLLLEPMLAHGRTLH